MVEHCSQMVGALHARSHRLAAKVQCKAAVWPAMVHYPAQDTTAHHFVRQVISALPWGPTLPQAPFGHFFRLRQLGYQRRLPSATAPFGTASPATAAVYGGMYTFK